MSEFIFDKKTVTLLHCWWDTVEMKKCNKKYLGEFIRLKNNSVGIINRAYSHLIQLSPRAFLQKACLSSILLLYLVVSGC